MERLAVQCSITPAVATVAYSKARCSRPIRPMSHADGHDAPWLADEAALEGGYRVGLGRRLLGDEVVFGGVGFELFELQLHLIGQAAAAFGSEAILLALKSRP